jgi:hypothetical protein
LTAEFFFTVNNNNYFFGQSAILSHHPQKSTNPMKQTKLLLTALALAVLSASSNAQVTITLNKTPGAWNVLADWNVGANPATALPTADDVVIINNSRTGNLTGAAAFANNLRVGNQDHATHFGRLNIGADLTVTSNLQIASGPNSEGYVTHTAGTVTFANNFQVASINAGSVAEYTISGGSLSGGATGNIAVGTTGSGLFHVQGASASVSSNSMNVGAGATIKFTMAASGVTAPSVTAQLSITDGATLVVDGAAYTGGPATITLVQFGTITGSFGDNVTFQNFGALTPSLQANSDNLSLVVVPEPSMVALLAGLGGLCVAGLRRARRSQA